MKDTFIYKLSNLIETESNKTEQKITVSDVRRRSSIQSRRLNLVKNVCDSYRSDPDLNRLYVENPGKESRGKFTLEPKSKLVMCNVMKQGEIVNLRSRSQVRSRSGPRSVPEGPKSKVQRPGPGLYIKFCLSPPTTHHSENFSWADTHSV